MVLIPPDPGWRVDQRIDPLLIQGFKLSLHGMTKPILDYAYYGYSTRNPFFPVESSGARCHDN